MKKLTMIMMSLVLSFTLFGCSSSESAEDAQKKVVDQFFELFKKGEIEKIDDLCTEGALDDFGIAEIKDQLKMYLDEEEYGKDFVKEAEKYVDAVFENYIREYKVKKIKEDGDDKVVVTVEGKRMDESSLDQDGMSEEFYGYLTDYTEENKDKIKNMIEEKGEEKAYQAVLADISKGLFKAMIDKLDDLDQIDFALKFTLVKKDGKWLIDDVQDEESVSTKKEDKIDTNEYEVDKAKLKASATLLKKGRLEENEYLATKYEKTDLEFVDYNVVNAAGEELSEYDDIDISGGTLKFQTEINGNKGSKVTIVISDDRKQIALDEYTLDQTRQVFEKEITGIDTNATSFSVDIYVGGTYDTEYDFGTVVGRYYIYVE